MTRSQIVSLIIIVGLTGFGTYVFLGMPTSSKDLQDLQSRWAGYIAFVATMLGFLLTIYQLGATERAIKESEARPTLNLEVLPYIASSSYASVKTDQLVLYPITGDESLVRARCAFRITNTGRRVASRVFYLSFTFKRTGQPEHESDGKIQVDYHEDSWYSKEIMVGADAFMRSGYTTGWTFRWADDFAVLNDYVDRPIVAEIELTMNRADFEPEYEIHYRIQSADGNYYPDSHRGKAYSIDRIYRLKLILDKGEIDKRP